MKTEKLVKLVETLADKTANGEVAWKLESTEFPNDPRLAAKIGKHKIALWVNSPEDEFTAPDYGLSFLDTGDSVIDSVSDVDLKDQLPRSYDVMRQLYNSAHRDAKGIGTIVDDLLKDLDGDLEF